MVKNIVFIVEGETEEIIVTHLKQSHWFDQFNLRVDAIFNVKGNGNLCSHNIQKFIEQALSPAQKQEYAKLSRLSP